MSATVPKVLYLEAKRNAAAWRKMAEALAAARPVPVITEPLRPASKRKTSPIAGAIKNESRGDARLARYLHGRANELKKEGKSPADIAAELSKWSTTEAQD